MTFTALVTNEMRRALHRRVVWVLIALALVGIMVLGVVAFLDSAGRSPTELGADGTHPALMADWWVAGSSDGILMIASLPLLLGGLFGAASVVGAEWRAGMVTTVLTWEPRRLRLHVARITACAVLATVIAFALEALFLAAALPAVLAHGSTAGTDAAWWWALLGGIVRLAVVTGAGAILAGSLATLGRGTTFALCVTFAWLAVGEGIVRSLRPHLQRHLLGDNLTIALTWSLPEHADYTRSPPAAALTVVVYLGLIAAVAALSFTRRDVTGAS